MSFLIIKNGRVIDPATKRDKVGDVFIADGKIAASLTGVQKKSAKVIDAKGLVVCPGLVDIHVHFREPGQTHKENILTGSQSVSTTSSGDFDTGSKDIAMAPRTLTAYASKCLYSYCPS